MEPAERTCTSCNKRQRFWLGVAFPFAFFVVAQMLIAAAVGANEARGYGMLIAAVLAAPAILLSLGINYGAIVQRGKNPAAMLGFAVILPCIVIAAEIIFVFR